MKYPKRSQYKHAKSPYRICNWPEYEAGLRRRGDLTIWFSDDAIKSWRAPTSGIPGGQRIYANIAIKAAMTIRMVYHLPLRQTEGFLLSLAEKLDKIPFYSGNDNQPIHLFIDSTGLRVHTGNLRKPPKNRAWRKLHVAVDANTGEIVASDLTSRRTHVCTRVPVLLGQIDARVASVSADGAYDTERVYEAAFAQGEERAVRMLIPPGRDAQLSPRPSPALRERNRNSRVLAGTLAALQRGGIVVIDISLLSSKAGEMLAGLILRKLFSQNQENFTGGAPIIPTIAVIEEAQSVLGKRLEDTSPFVEWVKEGHLGAMLITQQPGSLSGELLSQADNWFSFHLLSEGDAGVLGKYNSHFSQDVLAHLIGEPIPGNCFMWSAPKQPFVLPVRVSSFEGFYAEFVNRDDRADPVQPSLAMTVRKETADAVARLAADLRERLNDPKTKFVEMSDESIGVYDGQLYYLIKEIRTAADTTPEDQLKVVLLAHLLGEGVVQSLEHEGKKYFCATAAQWEAAGVTPTVRS